MVYKGTLKYTVEGDYVFPGALAATKTPPVYQKPMEGIYGGKGEPFYEVPKFPEEEEQAANSAAASNGGNLSAAGNSSSLSEEGETSGPKSSTSNSSKYSSSGYVGSELWDPEYFSSLNGAVTQAHCYTNPVNATGGYPGQAVRPSGNPTYGNTSGGYGHVISSPGRSSSGVSSESPTSGSSTNNRFRPVFFSPQPRHNTLFHRQQGGNPNPYGNPTSWQAQAVGNGNNYQNTMAFHHPGWSRNGGPQSDLPMTHQLKYSTGDKNNPDLASAFQRKPRGGGEAGATKKGNSKRQRSKDIPDGFDLEQFSVTTATSSNPSAASPRTRTIVQQQKSTGVNLYV